MISLFLDTCSHNIIVAILENNKVIYSKIEKNDNQLSEKLLPYIEEGFIKINKSVHDIDTIYVVNGPGSFTGIRIGVTVAKVMAWGLNKKIVTLSELEVLASIHTDKKYIVPLIDARRGYVYAGVYDQNLDIISKDEYILLDDLTKNIKDKSDSTLFVSYDSFSIDTSLPDIDIEKLVIKHRNDSSLNPHEVNPNYLKLTEAEEKLIDKNNK